MRSWIVSDKTDIHLSEKMEIRTQTAMLLRQITPIAVEGSKFVTAGLNSPGHVPHICHRSAAARRKAAGRCSARAPAAGLDAGSASVSPSHQGLSDASCRTAIGNDSNGGCPFAKGHAARRGAEARRPRRTKKAMENAGVHVRSVPRGGGGAATAERLSHQSATTLRSCAHSGERGACTAVERRSESR